MPSVFRPLRWVLFFPLACLEAGCGSSLDQKGDAALDRLQHQAKTGYVRVVNLTGTPIDVFAKGRPLTRALAAEKCTFLLPVGTGDPKLRVNDSDVIANVAADSAETVVAYPGSKTETLAGDERKPSPQANVRVVLAKGDGSAKLPVSGIRIEGASAPAITKEGMRLNLASGQYVIGGKPLIIEDQCAYTLLLVPLKGSLAFFPLKNTRNDKPITAGISKS